MCFIFSIKIECLRVTLKNGTVSSTGRTPGSQMFFQCSRGLTLVGRTTSTCMTNGKWSHVPYCKGIDLNNIIITSICDLVLSLLQTLYMYVYNIFIDSIIH